MAKWRDLPSPIRLRILTEYCNSLIFEYIKCPSRLQYSNHFKIAYDNPNPRPIVDYLNALLTCREFHRAITSEITTAVGQSTPLALQDIQFKLVSRYSGGLRGNADYREMPLAQAMFGHFWKNPIICENYAIFDDLFGGLDETGRLVLVCLSGGFLDKCKSQNEPGEDVKVQKLKRDESYQGLVFTRGSYHFVGDCMSFQTVNSCHFAVFEGHDLKECISFSDAAGGGVKRLGVPSKKTDLPKILASEPDSWWLAQFTDGKDDWKEWHLVNFKKKRIIVGPMGVATEWPAYLDLEEFHFWNFDWTEPRRQFMTLLPARSVPVKSSKT